MAKEIIATLVRNLRTQKPLPREVRMARMAAVSVILKEGEAIRTLLIKRAERPDDPWSGQIAFPGGKAQPSDSRPRDTAVRETLEEVGIDLRKSADFLGYAEPVRTHTGTMDVVPSVFFLKGEVVVKPNQEVFSHRWVELEGLASQHAKSTYKMNFSGQAVEMPAFAVGDYVVWGLTYRIVSSLLKDSGLL